MRHGFMAKLHTHYCNASSSSRQRSTAKRISGIFGVPFPWLYTNAASFPLVKGLLQLGPDLLYRGTGLPAISSCISLKSGTVGLVLTLKITLVWLQLDLPRPFGQFRHDRQEACAKSIFPTSLSSCQRDMKHRPTKEATFSTYLFPQSVTMTV